MSEDMGPYYYSCPTEYLDMVPDPRVGSSTDWRAKVMAEQRSKHGSGPR